MPADKSPIRPTDDGARARARALLAGARHAALGVIHPDDGAPFVSRIAFGLDALGVPLTLISDLALHAGALRRDARASVLVGEPGTRGDPLTHPRLTVQVRAAFVPRGTAEHDALRTLWLDQHPKSALYVDFADFSFVRLSPVSAALNGGFGKAYALVAADLRPVPGGGGAG